MRIRPLAPAAIAMMTVGLGIAGPVLGSPVSRATVAPRADASSRLASAPNPVFAGYVVDRMASRMATTTTLIVPKLKCTEANRAIAAGTGVFTAPTSTAAELFVGCVNGRPRYFPVLIVNGTKRNFKALAVRQGDKVQLKAVGGQRGVTVTVIDETHRGIQKTMTGRGSNQIGGPWVGDLAWRNSSRTERVPNFGKLRYSDSRVDGKRLGWYRKLQRFNRVSTTGVHQIKTGPLSGNREAFQTFFEHS